MKVEMLKLHESVLNVVESMQGERKSTRDIEHIWIPWHAFKFMRRNAGGGTRIYVGTNPQDFITVAESPELIETFLRGPRKLREQSAWQRFLNSWRKKNGSEGDTTS